MSAVSLTHPAPVQSVAPPKVARATTEPVWVRRVLIGVALVFLSLFLFVPLVSVFFEAFKKGWEVYVAAITEADAVSAMWLTLIAAAISELARNIVRYADHGEMVMRADHDGMMFVIARDQGPGIPDMQAALRTGYSTSGGLGLGLPGVRRIADHFEIVSNSSGTTVTLGKRRR